MTVRALVIAIEDYPQSRETSATLPGTVDNADRFVRWLEQHLHVPQSNIVYCCSRQSSFRTHGATRSEIKKAVQQLIQSGADDTERLIVFLSGHGVIKLAQTAESHMDCLLSSDFEATATSGDACVDVAELRTLLARSLGAGTHLYFVDCCRTVSHNLVPQGLGLQCVPASSGTAGAFQLHSTATGAAAGNDSLFSETVIDCLDGKCELRPDPDRAGLFWVTFQNVARAVENEFRLHSRAVEVCTVAEQADVTIRSVQRAGPAAAIRDPQGRKPAPVELLTAYDEVVFLGETNGQMPTFIEAAIPLRQQRRWKRLVMMSIDDLTQAGRPGVPLAELERERRHAEETLTSRAAQLADEVVLYRYGYPGTYGSLWTASDGRRHVHVSPRLLGLDIRLAPASDFIDFPAQRHPVADQYFQLAEQIQRSPETRCVFRHPVRT